jgi:outer membrane protein assembly factor BamB
LAGDRLFAVEPNRHVAAYRLADLEQLWRVELPTSGEEYSLVAVHATLVLAGISPGSGLSTLGLDTATGAVRWRHQAAVEGPTSRGLLLLASQHPESGAAPGAAEPGAVGQTLRAVRADTGDLVWSLDLPPGARHSSRVDGAILGPLAVTLPTGRVELRDVDTGKLLRSRQIGPRSGVPGDGYAEIIGSLLVVREASAAVAYELDDLDLRWRLPFASGYDGWPIPCGRAMCFLREGGGLILVDQATGRHKWSDRRWSGVLAEVDGFLIALGLERDEQIVVAVDADTGQVRRELGTWQQLHLDSMAESMIAIRYDPTRTVVARLDPARGTRILDVLPDIQGMGCLTEASRLLCWRTDGTLAMWRLPQ